MSIKAFDFIVVGAGIVGLSVARELRRRLPDARIAVLEKEAAPGLHASGRNSGVLHSGIYYGSDTLKARVCATGAQRMIELANAEGIAVRQSGKVILATSQDQLATVDTLMRNARENGIPAERLDPGRLKEIEPYAADAAAAIYCPSTAVIDTAAVLRKIEEQLRSTGVELMFGCAVAGRHGRGSLQTRQGAFAYGYMINCAGAYADRVAKSYGLAQEYALVPFKGIYWKLAKEASHKVRESIYPVPDVSMPFLGVHLTRDIRGDIYVGPTAIPALGRENYGLVRGVRVKESLEIVSRLAGMYLRNDYNFRKLAHVEIGKYSKHRFLTAARKLVPSLEARDMLSTPKTGIRPQLVNTRTSRLEMDYVLAETDDSLHVLNAISPAFTGAFAFAQLIVERVPAQ